MGGCFSTRAVDDPVATENQSAEKSEEYWLTRVQKSGFALQHAPESIRNNKSVVLAAVHQDGYALQFASPQLQADVDVVVMAVQNKGRAIEFAQRDFRNNKKVAIEAAKQDPSCLKFISPTLLNDRDVVMTACQNDSTGEALKWASLELRGDKQIVIAAIKANKNNLKWVADQNLKKDMDVISLLQPFE